MSNIYQLEGLDPPGFENLPKNNNDKIHAAIDHSNIPKYASGPSYGINNENIGESFINRPATALLRVIDKFSLMSGLGSNSTTLSKNSLSIMSSNKDKNVSTVLAYQLQSKVDKIIRVNNKLSTLQSELSNDLVNWASDIPNVDCGIMVKEFGNLLASQHDSNMSMIEKLDKLKLSFKLVNQREKKLKDLNVTKIKTIKGLRDNEVKYGPSASSTTFLNEKLEETVWNLDVLEQQYIRAISKDLKDSLVEYAATLQGMASILNDATSDYYNCLFNLEATADYIRSSPKKINTQNGIGKKGKENYLSSSNIFNQSHKSEAMCQPHQIEKSDYFNKSNDLNNKSPIKLFNKDRSYEEKSVNQSICSECYKTNRFKRIITPCTHISTQLSDQGQQQVDEIPPVSRMSSHEPKINNFRIREPSFQPAEQWS